MKTKKLNVESYYRKKLSPKTATVILKAARAMAKGDLPVDGYMLVCGFHKILKTWELPSLTPDEIREIEDVYAALSVIQSFKHLKELTELDYVIMDILDKEI